jgi:hypothetical protein
MSEFVELMSWVLLHGLEVITKMKGDHFFTHYEEISQIDLDVAMVHDFIYGPNSNFFSSKKILSHTQLIVRMLDAKMRRLGLYCPEFGELWERKRLQNTWMMCLGPEL